MADDEVRKILLSLELEHLMESFEENKITINVIKKLNENLISSLIPIIGDRAIFIDYWCKHFKNKYCNNLEFPEKEINCQKVNNENSSAILNVVPQYKNNSSMITLEQLKGLLHNSETGRRIIASYKQTTVFNEKQRSKLCNIIVTSMEDRSIRMDNGLAELVAKTIIELFPTEVLTTYYIPPVLKRNSPTNQSIPARGKLVSCYRNKKFQNKKLQTKLVAEARKDASFQAESLCDEITKESNKWLLANRAPWKLVREHWTVTSKLRMQEVRKAKDSNLARILGDWKLYDHPQGFELIDIDYQELNLSNINLDKKAWFEFFENLKEYSNISSKDETANMYMEQMCSRELKDDTKVVISLLLVAHLYPSKQMKKLNKKAFKPSIGVSKDSIVKFATIPGDVARIQKEVQERASTLKLTIQPYILIVGSIENIEDIYICMDEVLYKVSEAIQGIDICFKIFHVFQLEYPFASEHIWLLIQKGIYQFDTPFDKDIVSIQHVLHKLKEKNSAKGTQVSSEQPGVDDAETQ